MEFPGLARLTTAECRELLPSATVGRLAVPTPTFPTVEPVSFTLVEGEVVICARAGSAGSVIPDGTPVAFEADVLEHDLRRGWSVVVAGSVEDLEPDVASLVASRLSPWAAAPGDRLMSIRSPRYSGRRVVGGPAAVSPILDPATSSPEVAPALRRRVVDADESLCLLRDGGQKVGRLVIAVAGEPLVFPLNYGLDGEAVVFRTHVGTKLSGITRSMATFTVDQIDASGQGWSVTVQGLAQEIIDADPPSLRERVAAVAPETWPGGARPNVVRITPYSMRGEQWTPVEATVVAAGPGLGGTTPAGPDLDLR